MQFLTWAGSLLGVVWVISGILWLFRPQGLQKRFAKKFGKKMRWAVIGLIVFFSGVLFSAASKLGGFLGIALTLVASFFVLQGLLFLREAVMTRVLEWWAQRPLWVYRACAGVLILMGLGLGWVLRALGHEEAGK